MSEHANTDATGESESRPARLVRQGIELVSVVLFVTMFAAFILQIFFRYVLNSPLSWTLELCLLSFLWLTFWNCGMLLRLHEHIGFNLVYDATPPRVRRVLAIIGMTILGGTFLAALPGIIDWTMFMSIGDTDVFQLRLDFVFSIFVVFMIAVIVRALVQLRRLTGRDWHNWI